jgi:hypothetical protein
MKLVSPP